MPNVLRSKRFGVYSFITYELTIKISQTCYNPSKSEFHFAFLSFLLFYFHKSPAVMEYSLAKLS